MNREGPATEPPYEKVKLLLAAALATDLVKVPP